MTKYEQIKPVFDEKLFVLTEFYSEIDTIFSFSQECPKREYKLLYIEGLESVFGYPSKAALQKLKSVLGVNMIVDDTENQCVFGMFRYLLAGESPEQIGIHVDDQPWACIVYISPTVSAPATGIYRHKATGVYDLGQLDQNEREAFVLGPLEQDRYNEAAWECLFMTPFKQNTALLFKAGDLLHSNVMTWGTDAQTARITQNFNFKVM